MIVSRLSYLEPFGFLHWYLYWFVSWFNIIIANCCCIRLYFMCKTTMCIHYSSLVYVQLNNIAGISITMNMAIPIDTINNSIMNCLTLFISGRIPFCRLNVSQHRSFWLRGCLYLFHVHLVALLRFYSALSYLVLACYLLCYDTSAPHPDIMLYQFYSLISISRE